MATPARFDLTVLAIIEFVGFGYGMAAALRKTP